LNGLKKILREKDETISSNNMSRDQLIQLEQTNLMLEGQMIELKQEIEQNNKKISILEAQLMNYQSQLQELSGENETLEQ
jgi:hypothetical protein